MNDYRGTTVLVTGASGGIGEAIARQLAAQGANLVLTARSADRLEKIATALRAKGATVSVYPADLAAHGAVSRLMEHLHADGHHVDVYVANAGFGLTGPFHAQDATGVSEMQLLNMVHLTDLARALVPGMVERRRGGLLFVASTASFQALPYFAVYAATKSYVRSFSDALHAELKPYGIHVSCLCPGPTHTGFAQRASMSARMFSGAQSAEAVAAYGLAALRSNKRIAISGVANHIGVWASALAPKALLDRVSRVLFARGDTSS